jgi:hypothetical protein
MPYQRYLVRNGRVVFSGGILFPDYGNIISLSKEPEPEPEPNEDKKEVVGGSLGNNEALLRSRLNAVNFLKKQSDDLTRRLTAIEPKRKLINFTM